ncbi:transglycosylase SLT domain-containing protein [Streptomyces goshikiensis]|uniref:transglycosylase SLT domain-containing protein n=1 Tax=Streptomyces goshikiensis TaxID=1942 RepID=UPI0036A79361
MARHHIRNLTTAAAATCLALTVGTPQASASVQGPGEMGWLIRDVWRGLGATESQADKAVQVAACESGLDPNAVGREGQIGLFQFFRREFEPYGGNPYNPYHNSRAAFGEYKQKGWVTTWPSCG